MLSPSFHQWIDQAVNDVAADFDGITEALVLTQGSTVARCAPQWPSSRLGLEHDALREGWDDLIELFGGGS
jgi:hypothetical protein